MPGRFVPARRKIFSGTPFQAFAGTRFTAQEFFSGICFCGNDKNIAFVL
ncbi:MAG: hypothetical protein K6B46_05825 [Opitutales bacterium]|nr:hypothetical protein [Opitutales bacterium]